LHLAGGKEAGITPMLQSFDKMNIYDDQNKEKKRTHLSDRVVLSPLCFPLGAMTNFLQNQLPQFPLTPKRTQNQVQSLLIH